MSVPRHLYFRCLHMVANILAANILATMLGRRTGGLTVMY